MNTEFITSLLRRQTACNTCYKHMDRAARQEGMGLEIIDLPVLVAKAMGISLD
ncbi:MAG: hypothetical protein ABSB22_22485 [Thermodesulfobacteriota bacterium]